MHEQTDSGGIISESELAELTELFQLFEGVQAPLAPEPQQAKQQFHDMVVALYAAKVKPKFQSLSFYDFLTSRVAHAESEWLRMTIICVHKSAAKGRRKRKRLSTFKRPLPFVWRSGPSAAAFHR
jgi:hypothetical protein